MEMRPRPIPAAPAPLLPAPAQPATRGGTEDRGPQPQRCACLHPGLAGGHWAHGWGTDLQSMPPACGCWGRPGKWAPGRAEAPHSPGRARSEVRGAGRMPGQWREQGFCLPAPLPHLPEACRPVGSRIGRAPPPHRCPSPAQPGCGAAPVPPGPPWVPEGVWWRRDPGKGRGRAPQKAPGGPGESSRTPAAWSPWGSSRPVGLRLPLPPRGTGPKARTPT